MSLREGVGRSVQQLDEKVEGVATRNRLPIYALTLGMLALALFSAFVVELRFVRPIRRLASQANEIEAGRYDIDVSSSERADEIGDLQRAFARMSTSVRQHDSEIRHIAFTDSLTQLPNRRDFRERLDARLQTQDEDEAMALLFIDLDDFKRVNDTLGHETGDLSLIHISEPTRRS